MGGLSGADLEETGYRSRADEPGLYKERSAGAVKAAEFKLFSSFLPLVLPGQTFTAACLNNSKWGGCGEVSLYVSNSIFGCK